MSRNTGGRFFARPYSERDKFTDTPKYQAQDGATLHDVYAGMAMHALLSANPERRFSAKEIAIEAMLIADEMIAERSK